MSIMSTPVDCTCAMTESSFRSCPAHGEKGYLEYEARHRGENGIQFEIPVGDFVVSGRYDGPNNITIHRGDQVVRTLTVPGYKIWNVAAHCPEWLDELEAAWAAEFGVGMTTTIPLTATWSEVEDLDATEAILVQGWADALRHGQTARFVAALIESAVNFEPRFGLPMDVCERHGCSIFVDENARDDNGRLYCSAGHRDDAAHAQEQHRQGWAA